MVHWYVSFCRPCFLCPDGLQYYACFSVLVGGILRTRPKYLLSNIVDLIGSAFALLSTSSLVINLFYLMFKRLHKHLVWRLASFSSTCLVVFHVSEQLRSTSIALPLKILILVFIFIPFDFQIFVSF